MAGGWGVPGWQELTKLVGGHEGQAGGDKGAGKKGAGSGAADAAVEQEEDRKALQARNASLGGDLGKARGMLAAARKDVQVLLQKLVLQADPGVPPSPATDVGPIKTEEKKRERERAREREGDLGMPPSPGRADSGPGQGARVASRVQVASGPQGAYTRAAPAGRADGELARVASQLVHNHVRLQEVTRP